METKTKYIWKTIGASLLCLAVVLTIQARTYVPSPGGNIVSAVLMLTALDVICTSLIIWEIRKLKKSIDDSISEKENGQRKKTMEEGKELL